MKRRAFIQNSALAALATASYNAAGLFSGAQAQGRNVFTLSVPTGFPDFDPATSFGGDGYVLANCYETLTRYIPDVENATGRVEPLLAERWETSDDGLTWTFYLRSGVTFSDGEPLTSANVKKSIERTMRIEGGASFIWAPVEAIETPDDLTVVMKLAWQQPMDMAASAFYAAWIYSSAATDQDNAWFNQGNTGGTGPYVISRYEPGQRAILSRNEDYWGGWEDGQFDNVVFEVVEDLVLAQSMIMNGQADWTYNLPFENIEQLRQNPELSVVVNPSFQNLLGLINVQRAPLDDARVRQAISLAFPYDDVISAGTAGLGSRSKGALPPGIWGHDPDLPLTPTDLDAARELLDQAGIEPGLKITVTYNTGDALQALAGELWRANLATLGIDLELQPMAWEAQWELAKGDPQAAQDIYMIYWWPTFITPYDFLYSMFNTEEETVFNLGYYSNPEFDALLDEANVLSGSDRPASIAKFQEAQRIVVDEAAAVFMLDLPNVHFIRSDIEGYTDNPAYSHAVFVHQLRR